MTELKFKSIHSLAQTVAAGSVLFEEGTLGGGMVILLSGRLAVYRDGHKVATITEPGTYVGEATVLTGKQRSATVVADSSSTIIKLSSTQAEAFLQADAAENKVFKKMAERLQDANQQIVDKQNRLTGHRDAMTELLHALRVLYTEMDKANASPDSYYETMRTLRRLINTFGTGRFSKGRVQV
ncbi:MAG: cyclic nucleotide-binding domain-containing protein [Myxococcota bacterium]|nr:cyclic nucleotide-binding domain-containing protein [Myxococcota bacterium]